MHRYNYIVILFTASELSLVFFKRSKTASKKGNNDKRSLPLLWLAITGSLTLAGFISGFKIGLLIDNVVLSKIGLAFAICGFVIRWTAILQLGKLFTVDVAISNTHTLKTTGLYQIVRHPSYLGLMLIITGIALCMGNLLSLAIVVIPVFIAMNYRIVVEEKALTNEFGSQYLKYSKKVSKIIPWIY
jgi:protein-S-isoprenylcysteine O-methyltransferase Ste14